MEDLGLVEDRDRPVPPQWVCSSDPFQDGDLPVGSPVRLESRLDGLHQPEGCLSSGPGAFGQPSFSSVCGGWAGLPISSAVFWLFHSPTGLHPSHGSGVVDSPWNGSQVTPLRGRLAHSRLFPSRGYSREGLSSRLVSATEDRGHSLEVSPQSMLDCHLPGHGVGQPLFEGFPLSREGHDPAGADRRISILQEAKQCLLAESPRSPVSSGSRGTTPYGVCSFFCASSWTLRMSR